LRYSYRLVVPAFCAPRTRNEGCLRFPASRARSMLRRVCVSTSPGSRLTRLVGQFSRSLASKKDGST